MGLTEQMLLSKIKDKIYSDYFKKLGQLES